MSKLVYKNLSLFQKSIKFYTLNNSLRMASMFQPIRTIHPTGKHTGTIFFFHGAGDTGPGIYQWVKDLTGDKFVFPHLKIVFPTAPKRPYTAYGGDIANVWFDRLATSINVPEHKESLNKTCEDIVEMIEEEMKKNNFTKNQIIIGGFSMGGAVSMHLAFRYLSNIAGIFAMSAFLNHDTKVYETIESLNSRCPIFMAHGQNDTLVSYDWGKETFDNLKKVGVCGEFNSFRGEHELSKCILHKLHTWILDMVPDKS